MAKRSAKAKTAAAIADWAYQQAEPTQSLEPNTAQAALVQKIDGAEVGANKRLSAADHALIVRWADEGKTQTLIAQRLGVSQGRISQVLAEFRDSRPLARKRLEAGSLELAQRIVADADPDQAIDVLERLEVLPPKQAGGGGGITIVNQVAGMAGLPVAK